MTSGFLSTNILGGLAFRVLLFLSLALLPLGLIAVSQTREIARQSRESAELSLIAVTEQATATERTSIQEALGAADALASIVVLVRDDPQRCSDFLRSYAARADRYRNVGFIDMDRRMNCSSAPRAADLTRFAAVQDAFETQKRTVTAAAEGPISEQEIVIATVPVFDNDQMVGIVSVSMAQSDLIDPEPAKPAHKPNSLVTFNHKGEILISERAKETTRLELPKEYTLQQLTQNTRQVFEAESVSGKRRAYAVIPLVPGSVFAMSIWPSNTPILQTNSSGWMSSLLPFMMWAASLVVAFWALNRLAITHIRKLGRQMRQFALNRTLPRNSLGGRVPYEIVEMERSFIGMADSILQDEARLEDSLREKNILLKEVHHRVKNNLQLISSIMNMQIRQAPTRANRLVLQRLQDRILGLATVHKSLYHGDEMTRVNARDLLKEIVARNLSVGLASPDLVDVKEHYDEILVSPDDAAPLTLLVSEAVTNALKYTPQKKNQKGSIDISLKYVQDDMACLRIVNTSGGVPADEGTGLGSRLIQAFARQLNGDLKIVEESDTYAIELTFPVPRTDKAVYDY